MRSLVIGAVTFLLACLPVLRALYRLRLGRRDVGT